MGRDHSIECEKCGALYGGFDGPDQCPCQSSSPPEGKGRPTHWCQGCGRGSGLPDEPCPTCNGAIFDTQPPLARLASKYSNEGSSE